MNALGELQKRKRSIWLDEIFQSDLFNQMLRKGARVQRPQWASTGTKNHAYSDVLYVEELIGPDTVNTILPDTLAAFRDHGHVRGDTVLENIVEAESQLRALPDLGIDLNAIAASSKSTDLRLSPRPTIEYWRRSERDGAKLTEVRYDRSD